MSDKPVIFISHSSKDKQLALILQEQIANVLGLDKGNVFLSTDPYAIAASSEWFEEIKRSLDNADAFIVLVTPSSMESMWVGYEIGYFWHKENGRFIYSLIMNNTKLAGPIERLQGKSLDDETQFKAFFNSLYEQFKEHLERFDSGKISHQKIVGVVSHAPSFLQAKIKGREPRKREYPRS